MRKLTAECAMTRKLVDELRSRGARVFSCVGSGKQGSGWPDRYICHPTWTGWIEFKGPKTRFPPIQRNMIRDLNARSPRVAAVVRFRDDGSMTILSVGEDKAADHVVAVVEGAVELLHALRDWTRSAARG